MAAKKFLPPREGAAEGGVWGEFRRARAFRRSEAEAVSFPQNGFAQSLEYSTNNKPPFGGLLLVGNLKSCSDIFQEKLICVAPPKAALYVTLHPLGRGEGGVGGGMRRTLALEKFAPRIK